MALIMITDRAVINFNFRQGNNANFVMRTIAALPNPTTSSRTNLADGFRVAREQVRLSLAFFLNYFVMFFLIVLYLI